MHFRAVGRRCAVDLKSLDLPYSPTTCLQTLVGMGCRPVDVDPVLAAYRLLEAGGVVPFSFDDCSGFLQRVYAECGIWIPRRIAQQFAFGERVSDQEIRTGDLVFSRDRLVCIQDEATDEPVSHVVLVCPESIIIHAVLVGGTPNAKIRIVRSPLHVWTEGMLWRGARRIIPAGSHMVTLVTPPNLEVETSDDLRCLIYESLEWHQ